MYVLEIEIHLLYEDYIAVRVSITKLYTIYIQLKSEFQSPKFVYYIGSNFHLL